MESLYAEAAACTQGEERARTLTDSIRQHATRMVEFAAELERKAIFELETRAVEVDGLLESDSTQTPTPFVSPSLVTLEALDKLFVKPWDEKRLEDAADEGDVGVVNLLIQMGVDPSADDNHAICLASSKGQLPVVERLLQDERVNPSADNNAAFRMAAQDGHLDVVNRLLQDSRVDPSTSVNFAIRAAAQEGYLHVVNRLLQDKRVDPAAGGDGAIRLASQNGHLPVVDRLLQDERVDPTADFNNAISHASRNGHLSVVERLLQDERVRSSLPAKWLEAFRAQLSR